MAASRITLTSLGSSGLSVSPVGFGGYRIDHQVEEHRQALAQALMAGVNLVDTSANYTDGNSEILIGQVLEELFAAGKLRREDMVVVSKAGYLQGANLEDSQRRAQAGAPWPELVSVQPGLEHCLHPDFLADQITRSLERLRLKRLDALLLHNPEYYLQVAEREGLPLGQARAEYLRRITQAFAHLEGEVAKGRLGCYGISSNTFARPSDDYRFTSLFAAWHAAAQAHGPEHRFRVIQLPLNLMEPGAVLEKNQPGGKSVLELASELDLGVLVNRPLNAIVGDRLLRLAEVEVDKEEDANPLALTAALAALQASEDHLRAQILPALGWEQERQAQVAEFLSAAGILSDHRDKFQDLMHLREAEQQYFVPRVGAALRLIYETLGDSPQARSLVADHLDLVRRAFWLLAAPYRLRAAEECAAVKDKARAADPQWAAATRLSQVALRAPRSTAGVGAVLVGMRRPAYVDDVLEEMARPVERRERREAWSALGGAEGGDAQ